MQYQRRRGKRKKKIINPDFNVLAIVLDRFSMHLNFSDSTHDSDSITVGEMLTKIEEEESPGKPSLNRKQNERYQRRLLQLYCSTFLASEI